MKFVKSLPPSNQGSRNSPKIDLLKSKPGQWALVRERATGSNSVTYRNRGCEVTMRTSAGYEGTTATDRRYDIYARWPSATGKGAK